MFLAHRIWKTAIRRLVREWCIGAIGEGEVFRLNGAGPDSPFIWFFDELNYERESGIIVVRHRKKLIFKMPSVPDVLEFRELLVQLHFPRIERIGSGSAT